MKRLSSLIRLNEYLRGFRVPGFETVIPVAVTDQADATARLGKSSGMQVLFARPEMRFDGEDSDSCACSLSTVLFVLDKELGQSWTAEREDEGYARMAEVASAVLDRVAEDTVRCSLLAGMRLSSADVMPEKTVFGGWYGYSVEINFE